MAAVSDTAVREDLAFAGAAALAQALRDREVSSRELTEMFLERIERIDPQLNAFRVVWRDEALAAADEADKRIAAGPTQTTRPCWASRSRSRTPSTSPAT